ncbi:hypothetical protein [Agaribacterium sp. ZY112]|uniref:hypothetical protein n=1 Tax=Agaribacterium sp. ZY112 TaxID=3233574 RepID=UPI003524C7FF
MKDYTEAILKKTESESTAIDEFTIPNLSIDKSWQADWLLSDFRSPSWKLKKHGSYFNLDSEKWEKVIQIYWNIKLPNGKKLTDKIYKQLLITIQKMVFLARQGYAFLSGEGGEHKETTRSQQQADIARSLILIIKWMITKGYQPELYGFRILTEHDIEQFISEARFGSQMIDGTYYLIESHLRQARNNNLLNNYLNKGRVNYPKICKEIGITKGNEKPIAPSARLQTVINNAFETAELPQWLDQKYSTGRELPSNRAKKFKSAGTDTVSISNLSGMLIGFRIIGRFASILTEELEGLGWCAELNAADFGKKYGYKNKERTPTVPIHTALEYLDKSLAWVTQIGPDLVKAKHDCDAQLKSLMKGKTSGKDHYAKQIDINLTQELTNNLKAQGLSITRYNSNPTNKNNAYIRDHLSIEEAVECLVAASFIIISTFSCKRISETLGLTVNCTRPALDGGWEIVFGLRKASPVEALSFIGRPIPDAAEQAIDLLVQLRPDDFLYLEENPELEPLFLTSYNTTKKTRKAVQREAQKMYASIELFADVVQIKSTEEGRRWYLRSHECRRFFAITYFWHDKFSGLPALSWFMGHNDIDATMHYVTEEIAASEIPEEEARYTAFIMQEDDTPIIPGLEKLEKSAELHFDTENLKIINQQDLESYLKLKFEEGYRIIKHGHNAQIIYLEEQR